MTNTHKTNEKLTKAHDRSDRYDKVCQILQRTHDGDNLSEFELWIVQEAVNNHLNTIGWSKFDEIYDRYVVASANGSG